MGLPEDKGHVLLAAGFVQSHSTSVWQTDGITMLVATSQ